MRNRRISAIDLGSGADSVGGGRTPERLIEITHVEGGAGAAVGENSVSAGLATMLEIRSADDGTLRCFEHGTDSISGLRAVRDMLADSPGTLPGASSVGSVAFAALAVSDLRTGAGRTIIETRFA